MMNFTDLSALGGIYCAIAMLALQLPFVARLSWRKKMAVIVTALIVLLIPIDGLSALAYVRCFTNDLSITSLLLLASFCWTARDDAASAALRRNRKQLLLFIAVTTLLFYPFALGVGLFDPFQLGYGNQWFIASLLLLTLGAWWLRATFIALAVALAVLAWSIGWYESNNLWTYLLDPWVAVAALGAVMWMGVRTVWSRGR